MAFSLVICRSCCTSEKIWS